MDETGIPEEELCQCGLGRLLAGVLGSLQGGSTAEA
jgi:hypothetical protein